MIAPLREYECSRSLEHDSRIPPRMTIPMQELDGSVRSIEPELLLQQIRSRRPMTIIDVRVGATYRGPDGRIAGARSMPLQNVPARCATLEGHRNDPIVIVSSCGIRARLAALELTLAGFTEVCALAGGMERWNKLKFPVEVGAGAWSIHS